MPSVAGRENDGSESLIFSVTELSLMRTIENDGKDYFQLITFRKTGNKERDKT